MTPKELTAFRIDPDQMNALRVLKERDGIRISEQVRRAIEEWLGRNGATPRDVFRAFDDLEHGLTAKANRGGGLHSFRLPKGFGPALEYRPLGSLTKADMELLDRFAKAAGRPTRSYWDFWRKAVEQNRNREVRRNMELPRMTDDEVRRELFASLVERLKAERAKDPSLNVIDRSPLLQSLSTNGHMLTVDQGERKRLMRVEMKWRPGPDEDEPSLFYVTRSTDRMQLVMNPGPEGDFNTIIDDIVRTFLYQAR
jgi:hypothetical protein